MSFAASISCKSCFENCFRNQVGWEVVFCWNDRAPNSNSSGKYRYKIITTQVTPSILIHHINDIVFMHSNRTFVRESYLLKFIWYSLWLLQVLCAENYSWNKFGLCEMCCIGWMECSFSLSLSLSLSSYCSLFSEAHEFLPPPAHVKLEIICSSCCVFVRVFAKCIFNKNILFISFSWTESGWRSLCSHHICKWK